jgi:hypothetical protein
MPLSDSDVFDRSFYERLVRELEEMATAVRDRPEINHKTAARLEAIANEIRRGAKLEPPGPPRK